MKFTFRIIKEHNLLIETVLGEITVDGLAEKTQAVFEHPDYSPSLCGLLDLRKASSGMTKVELYGFVAYLNQTEKFGHSKWAIIASDPIVVALSQIFQHRFSDDLITVVGSPEAAADFLEKPVLLRYVKSN